MMSFTKKKKETPSGTDEKAEAPAETTSETVAAGTKDEARKVEDRASLVEEKDAPAPAGGEAAPKVSYVSLAKELMAKASKAHPYWLGFHGLTLLFVCMGLVKLVLMLFRTTWHAIVNYKYYAWLLYYVTTTVLFTVMYVVAPIVLVIGDAWIFRSNLVDLAVWYMKKKKCTLNKCTIEGTMDRKAKQCQLVVTELGLRPDDTTQDIVSIESVSLTAKMMKTPKELKNGVDLELIIDHLQVNFITYDMKFKDTNLKRLLTQLQGEEVEEEPEPEPEVEEQVGPKETEPRYNVVCRILKSSIEVKGKTPMGVQPIIPAIVLDDEVVDFRIFARKFGLMKWINGLVLRTVANSSLDLASNVFKGVGGLATGVTGAAFDGVDAAAGYVPGGSIVKGTTGAVRNVLGGAVTGGGKVVGGVTGGGKHIVQGLTSGSVSGVAKGFYKAGESVGGGVVGGVASVGSGVVDAGASVGGGFVDAGKGAQSTVSGGSSFLSSSTPADQGNADAATNKEETKEEVHRDQAPDSATKKKKSSYMTMFSHKK